MALLFAALLARHAVVHAQSSGPNQLSVYAPQTSYTVPLLDVNGQPYVGLVELFEPLGPLDARVDGKKYKVHFTPPGGRPWRCNSPTARTRAKFAETITSCRQISFFRMDAAMFRLSVVSDLVSKLLATDTEFHPASRRLFIGNVQVRYTLELHKDNPSRLLLGFSVAGQSLDRDRTWTRAPHLSPRTLVSTSAETIPYSDPLITGVTFSEHDGLAEIDITGTAPLMANFADGGKTIIVTGAPAPPPPPQEAPAPPPAPVHHAKPRRHRRGNPLHRASSF